MWRDVGAGRKTETREAEGRDTRLETFGRWRALNRFLSRLCPSALCCTRAGPAVFIRCAPSKVPIGRMR